MFVAASPVIAFPLAVGITDPPILALMFLTLALIARPSGVFRAAIALGVACAMKATAWPAVPVFTAMVAARDAARSAWRFTAGRSCRGRAGRGDGARRRWPTRTRCCRTPCCSRSA